MTRTQKWMPCYCRQTRPWTVYPYGARFDIEVANFARLDIGIFAYHTVPDSGKVHGGEWTQETAIGGGTMDICIIQGQGVLDKKTFRGFWIVRKVVDQCFDQCAGFNVDELVLGHFNIKIFVLKSMPLPLEFVTTNI